MKFLQRLINNFRKLPSVGPKQAERFALYVLKTADTEIDELVSSIIEVKKSVRLCAKCNNYTLEELCDICKDDTRERKICIIETPFDLISIEKTQVYNGKYFVLGGNLVPITKGSDFNSRIEHLRKIIKEGSVDEVIIALDATTEGQMTSIYIKKALSDMGIKISRIAYGVPLGADIDYMDGFTLSHALKKRVPIEEE